ncbi:glycoside hydrolase family 92 protein [Suillus subluteus]|nr:glycoside hydrolase family 92 protein [Suillus subluteus]
MACWLVLLSALFLLAGSSAHPRMRLATHSRPKLTVRSQTDTATTLPGNTTITDLDPASYANVFIGTTNGGHVFPGATLPHGMVKVGLDTDSPGNQAGYDANITFSLHDSGTGGHSRLSNFKLWPLPECGSFSSCNTSMFVRNDVTESSPDDAGSPGYFATNLCKVELTASRRTALHRYTFPPSSREPRIVVDITNDGLISNTEPVVNVNTTTGRVTGGARFASSFGPKRYSVYTCVDFKGDGYDFEAPTEYGVWMDNAPEQNSTQLIQLYSGFVSEMGALLTFPPSSNSIHTTILARVARGTWNELLSRIQVDTQGVDNEITELFYSSLYRMHISPADYTGENPNWSSTEPYYDSFYCNWDTYRTLYPLMSLHDPEVFARIVRGMINIQQHEGWLPECRGATVQQFIQGGSNGDPILGEFFVKSMIIEPTDDLYTALLADAEEQSPNWNLQGRQTTVWKQYNFIPSDIYGSGGTATKQVSRTLEYSFGDFSISQVARILNKSDDVAKYQARAGNFFNVWNEMVTLPGNSSIKGMIQPRFADGQWNYTDPRHCSVNDPLQSTCYLDATNRDGFYESSPMVYVPQDTAKLISLQGGNESFINRLDLIFDQNYFDVTDEPSQQIPFMYHYANRPGLSTQRSRMIISESYNTTVSGLPGNDDSGAMASYAVFYLAGMYPLPATRQFLLASPYFPKITFYNPLFNTTTTIIANNFRGNPQSGIGGTVFVKSVTIDGQPWHSNCYLDWDVFVNGSTVELELTSDINTTCGEGSDALPPSLSTGGYSGSM